MRIGEVATRAGVSTRALRYYEEQKLIEPARTAAGQRIFTDATVPRVRLIQQLYAAGLSSRLLARILPGIDAGHLDAELVHTLESEHARLGTQIQELQAAHRRLAVMIKLSTSPHDSHCPSTLDEAVDEMSDSDEAIGGSSRNRVA